MKKPIDTFLKEYCHELSDEHLKFLSQRFAQKLYGDTVEILDFLGSNKAVDKWFSSACSCENFYEMLDSFQEIIEKENQMRQPA